MTRTHHLLNRLTSFFGKYMIFTTPDQSLVAALWTIGTYLWPHFDAYPYLLITSATKQSGKTRLAELASFACSNPRFMSGMTPAAVFQSIRDEKPTLFMDEAELLKSDATNMFRAVLNAGYRRGQCIPRVGKKGIVEWPAYCPKAFILIGETTDTLRDRSIIVRLQRGTPKERFVWNVAQAEGNDIGEALKIWAEDNAGEAMDLYANHEGLAYLPGRDEEIWLPLFVIHKLMGGELERFQQVSVDLATEKTMPRLKDAELEDAELKATQHEYAERLIRDLATIMTGHKRMFTEDVLKGLKLLPTGPWRMFRGRGLTAEDMGHMLDVHNVHPVNIKVSGKVKRGYKREEVRHALEGL